MTPDGLVPDDLRRLVPPPRRRPGVVAVAVRWRCEIMIAAVLAFGAHAAGPVVTGLLAGMGAIVVALVPAVRRAVVAGVQTLVVPHRVRAGLVQAGATDRDGRLPWLVAARPRGDAVIVSVWLRAGVTLDDLRRSAPVLATACGAAQVEIVRPARARTGHGWSWSGRGGGGS
ncbi:hypothetical protein BJF78_19705 [Pseudonocardia sp. CNS-139]|nr:hypothetical protein BJF78_19705 [Pseudonocardia sp. CNS-139]